MKKKIFTIFVSVFLLAFFVSFAFAAASDGLPGENLDFDGVVAIFRNFACWLWRIAITASVIALAWSAIRFMLPWNADKIADNRRFLGHVLIAITIITGAYVIIAIVAQIVGYPMSLIPGVC